MSNLHIFSNEFPLTCQGGEYQSCRELRSPACE